MTRRIPPKALHLSFREVLMRPVFSDDIKNSFSFLLFIGKCTTFGYPVNL